MVVRRDAVEDVRRRDRLRRGLEEAAEWIREPQLDRQRVDHDGRHVPPGLAAGPRVLRVRKDAHRERDVVGGDRRAVLPELVGSKVERPRPPEGIDVPARCQITDDRAPRPESHEPSEQERHERAIRGGPGAEGARVRRATEDALDVGARGRDTGAWAGPRCPPTGGMGRAPRPTARSGRGSGRR